MLDGDLPYRLKYHWPGMELDRRGILIGATATLVSACYRGGGGPASQPLGVSPPDVSDIGPEGPRAVLNPSRIPAEFREAPMLAAEVAAGRLPPVRERIGRDPLVIEPLHEIGRYGGDAASRHQRTE